MITTPKSRRDQIEQRSREFSKKYAAVGPLFDKYTFELIRRGYRHGGAKAIWERIRWESPVGADGRAAWKLPNSYCTWFARKFARLHPGHAGFFRFRRLTSADRPPREGREKGPKDHAPENA
jgi:hypothetical protein